MSLWRDALSPCSLARNSSCKSTPFLPHSQVIIWQNMNLQGRVTANLLLFQTFSRKTAWRRNIWDNRAFCQEETGKETVNMISVSNSYHILFSDSVTDNHLRLGSTGNFHGFHKNSIWNAVVAKVWYNKIYKFVSKTHQINFPFGLFWILGVEEGKKIAPTIELFSIGLEIMSCNSQQPGRTSFHCPTGKRISILWKSESNLNYQEKLFWVGAGRTR